MAKPPGRAGGSGINFLFFVFLLLHFIIRTSRPGVTSAVDWALLKVKAKYLSIFIFVFFIFAPKTWRVGRKRRGGGGGGGAAEPNE